MNKQLKFRVWNKNAKQFILNGSGLPTYFNLISWAQYWSECLRWDNLNSLVVQQFTGLKDKDGKEIFEGDIIEYYIPWNEETVTRQVVYDETFLQFMSYDLNRRGVFLYEVFEMKKLKVVGNIYENPELLK